MCVHKHTYMYSYTNIHTKNTRCTHTHRSYLVHIHNTPRVCIHRHGPRNMRAHACTHLHTQQECMQCTYKHMYVGLYKYSSPTYITHNATLANFSVDSGKRSCSGLLLGHSISAEGPSLLLPSPRPNHSIPHKATPTFLVLDQAHGELPKKWSRGDSFQMSPHRSSFLLPQPCHLGF